MGALPKQRISRHRQGNRRRFDFIKKVPVLVACNTCSSPHVVHHVCPTCGYYRGRQVLVIEERRRQAE
jgi:large subunit ribosomal protein L32